MYPVTGRQAVADAGTVWQAGLFSTGEPSVEPSLPGLHRVWLDESSWYDHLPGWLAGADHVFAELAGTLAWRQRRVPMYQRIVDEPRLTWWWTRETGRPLPMPVMEAMLAALTGHYGVRFDSVGCNWYRHGRDSVAFHGDRHRFWVTDPVVAIVSVGEPRPFQLRRRGGGRSQTLHLGGGDLLVMGGRCQDDWEHAVPKVAAAGPRISITYRHGTGDFEGEEPAAGGRTRRPPASAGSRAVVAGPPRR